MRMEFKIEDLWIGVFWRTAYSDAAKRYLTHIWICLVPCVPIHISYVAKLRSAKR